MSYDDYRLVYMIGLGMCIFFLVLAIILFIALKIPKVIGDLTGATARKAINIIREQNENNVDNYKSSKINKERGRLTDKISQSGRLVANDKTMGLGIRTEKISTQQLSYDGSDETTVLNLGTEGNETTVLATPLFSNETTVLNGMGQSNETTVLNVNMSAGFGNTEILEPVKTYTELEEVTNNAIFEILYEITYIHTSELIM